MIREGPCKNFFPFDANVPPEDLIGRFFCEILERNERFRFSL